MQGIGLVHPGQVVRSGRRFATGSRFATCPKALSNAPFTLAFMRPEIDFARGNIRELFGEQLDALEALINFNLEVGDPWRGRPLGDEHDPVIGERDQIIAGLQVRASNTAWAALEMCRIGFGERALMLERSLFEDMADIYWVAQSVPAEVVERFNAHEEHDRMLLFEAMTQHPEIFEVEQIPTFDQARRSELDGLFGNYGQKSWTGKSIYGLVMAIQHWWPEGEERNWLQFFRRIVHRQNNAVMHVTSQALSSSLRHQDAEGLTYNVGPTANGVEAALWNGLWMYAQVLKLCMHHFDFPEQDRNRLQRLFTQGWALFKTLTTDDMRGVGRKRPVSLWQRQEVQALPR
jgi:hypothetical protein